MDQSVKLITPAILPQKLPGVLTIAGSDSSGGAGIEADIKTFTSHGVFGLTCITALTAQNTCGVYNVTETPRDHLEKTFDVLVEDFVAGHSESQLKTVKTGMLTSSAVDVLLSRLPILKKFDIPLVVDPVLVSTSGSTLTAASTLEKCIDQIMPLAFLCTPNFVEAEKLWQGCGKSAFPVKSVADLKTFTVQLQAELGCENLLVKGGHIPWLDNKRYEGEIGEKSPAGLTIVDVLYESKIRAITVFISPFVYTDDTHGTGCTLASSIAANLAKGTPIKHAVTLSIHYIHQAMVSMSKLGKGSGPLNHTIRAETSVRQVLEGRSSESLITKHGNMLEFFKSQPEVAPDWKVYTSHEFVRQVANNTLPFDRFLFFLKQDFYYLVNYAQIHGLAASVAPDCSQIEAQALIITSIMTEIERHKEKLLKAYGIDYATSNLDKELEPARPCIKYCDYLMQIGRNEDFLGIKVALAPCLHGYAEAGVYGRKLREKYAGGLGVLESEEQSKAYLAWIDDYDSDWYIKAHQEGIETLDSLFRANAVSEMRLQELTRIFHDVTLLEVQFWDEVVRT